MEEAPTFPEVKIRDFDDNQIAEINQYVQTNIPFTILNSLYTLTDNPIDKARVFTVVYRLMQSARDYTGNADTMDKLTRLLELCKSEYAELYEALHILDRCQVNYVKFRRQRKIVDLLLNPDRNEKINRVLNAFMVFMEKQTLLPTDTVMGLDISNEEGTKLEKEIRSIIEKAGI